jgi:hypothetical protein
VFLRGRFFFERDVAPPGDKRARVHGCGHADIVRKQEEITSIKEISNRGGRAVLRFNGASVMK